MLNSDCHEFQVSYNICEIRYDTESDLCNITFTHHAQWVCPQKYRDLKMVRIKSNLTFGCNGKIFPFCYQPNLAIQSKTSFIILTNTTIDFGPPGSQKTWGEKYNIYNLEMHYFLSYKVIGPLMLIQKPTIVSEWIFP